ncbi:MAG TPA: hypothetical protein VFL94_17155 [Actinomycetales bacterium]|nr:hypothetical protein [Actinomycetales bacterium]
MSRPPYVTYLRVLVPVDSLAAHQRERWSRYADDPPSRRQVSARQFADTVRRLAGRPPVVVPPAESTDGVVVVVDGRCYVCPEQPRLRAWQGLRPDGVSRPLVVSPLQVPAPEVSAMPGVPVPETLREQAAADLASYVERGGDPRLFSRTSTWHVPLSWFVLFTAAERRLSLGRDAREAGNDVRDLDDGEERSLRYLTAMSSARRRCAIALRTARRQLDDLPFADELEQLGRWLEEFHPHSLVELDYGGLVDLIDDVHLEGDDSVADVQAGLEALADGDASTAAAAYQRLGTRWTRVALLARSS